MIHKILIFLLLLIAAIFYSCSGSESYRGPWLAMDTEGNKYEIIFEEKSFILNKEGDVSKTNTYTQNSIEIVNTVATYGIQLSDGRDYYIKFPNTKDKSKALLLDENDNTLYSLGRDQYINYEDINDQ